MPRNRKSRYLDTARQMATKYKIPPRIFLAMVETESGWNPSAISGAGAVGLGQLMPATARTLGVDPFNPRQNLDGAARHLRAMHRQTGNWRDALRAYNQGFAGSQSSPDAGAEYAEKVMSRRANYAREPGPPPPRPLGRIPSFGSPDFEGLDFGSLMDFIYDDDPTFAAKLKGIRAEVEPFAEADAQLDGGTTVTPISPKTGKIYAAKDPRMNDVLAAAATQIGQPYVWGGESRAEGGFDCSGLIDWAFREAGIDLPGRLTTWTAAKMGVSVKGKQLMPGDWVISNGGKHMTMYVGDGKVIAAPRRGTVVQYQPLPSGIVDVRRWRS